MAAVTVINNPKVIRSVSRKQIIDNIFAVIPVSEFAEQIAGIIRQDDNKNAKMRAIECATRLIGQQEDMDRQDEREATKEELEQRLMEFFKRNNINNPEEARLLLSGEDPRQSESDD